MRETPSAPAALQGLLRYFHRSRAACAEKHLCARGTALWTHIRNLMCKGKVGQWVWVSAGLCRGRVSVARRLSHLLSLSLCLLAELANSQFWRGKGPSDDHSLEGKERFLLLNLLVSLC